MSFEKLIMRNQDIHFFPKNIPKIFPNLQELEITNCKLKEIEAEDLKGLDKLISLKLANNCLRYLPDDLFKHVPNLQYADFSDNNINLKLLEPLKNNQRVELQGNRIKNIKF
jgi:Leucine-rich repeat (LRR) protein